MSAVVSLPEDPVDVPGLVDRMLYECRVPVREVARRMGVVMSAISHYRKGRRAITVDKLERLADACGYRVELRLVRRYEVVGDAVDETVVNEEPPVAHHVLDALNRPWLRTAEGWAPGPGNALRVRLQWDEFVQTYGPVRPHRDARHRVDALLGR